MRLLSWTKVNRGETLTSAEYVHYNRKLNITTEG